MRHTFDTHLEKFGSPLPYDPALVMKRSGVYLRIIIGGILARPCKLGGDNTVALLYFAVCGCCYRRTNGVTGSVSLGFT